VRDERAVVVEQEQAARAAFVCGAGGAGCCLFVVAWVVVWVCCLRAFIEGVFVCCWEGEKVHKRGRRGGNRRARAVVVKRERERCTNKHDCGRGKQPGAHGG
jgi:hypothetical protein